MAAKKSEPAAELPRIRVVTNRSSVSLSRKVRIRDPAGDYVIDFPQATPVLLVGEHECNAVDQDVTAGGMRELKIPDRHARALLTSLVAAEAAERIRLLEADLSETRGQVKLLENELQHLAPAS